MMKMETNKITLPLQFDRESGFIPDVCEHQLAHGQTPRAFYFLK
jgi:hypothetical protein